MENSNKVGGWGRHRPNFPIFFFEKKHKHLILSKKHFKTNLFFSIFGWGDPSQLGSWSEGCAKSLKLSREAIGQVSEDPYHTEFVSWRVDHSSLF